MSWSPCSSWELTVPALLLLVILLLGMAPAAKADEFVGFRDSSLRAAVASQLASQGQIPPSSDGTAITTSDMEALETLSAPDRGIVELDGLQCADNLAALDLRGNEITDINALGGLAKLVELDVSGNDLDVTTGSPAMSVVATLEALGTRVSYRPQRAHLCRLAVSSSASTYGKSVTFSSRVTPGGAAASGSSKVRLYHLETKSVARRVKGKKKTLKINYWRLRRTLTMRATSSGTISVKGKLPYAGKWEGRVVYSSAGDYVSCTSTFTAFVIRDPRIDAAIRWATRRKGSHAWDHYCLRFVCECYASGARTHVRRYESARQASRALHAVAHRDTRPPRGAWVFYDSTPLGHVGISLGNGTMINDYGGAGVEIMRTSSAGHYIGWAAPPLSPPITDWNQPTKR